MDANGKPALVRAIGRWSLAALVLNSIIGSGIFGLPSVVAGLLGTASTYAYLIAALGVGIIMACFAEVASQFREAGGPYLYTREAFGRFIGIQMGWLAWLVRLTSVAANANLFVIYLDEFWPAANQPLPRLLTLTLIIGVLAGVNYRGVSAGAHMSNVFAIAKLGPLCVFVLVGLFFLGRGSPIDVSATGTGKWMEAVLLLIFAYGGFEAGLMPMGEAKNPRRDAPFALFTALGTVTVIYTLVHVVVLSVLPDPAGAQRPLAAAARQFLGPAGAIMITLGALISVYGYLSSQTLIVPRLTFAFAEQHDFPQLFAKVHPRFRTPHVSIVIFAVLVLALAVAGTFRWNVLLSAVARLFTYGFVCAALIVLRKKRPEAPAFRLPAGPALSVLGILFSLVLVTRMGRNELLIIGGAILVALGNWLWVRKQ